MNPRNTGIVDRVFRVSLGVVMLLMAAGNHGSWIGWFGLIPLITGLLGRRPIYALVGLSTCRVDKPESDENEASV